MFEKEIQFSQFIALAREERVDDGGLSMLSWPELLARFTAARDLRRVMAKGDARGAGSFASDAARHLSQYEDAICPVNLVDLGNGKGLAHINAEFEQQKIRASEGSND